MNGMILISFFILYLFNSFKVTLVSSRATYSTLFNVSIPLNVISLRLPIGVDIIKSLPFKI